MRFPREVSMATDDLAGEGANNSTVLANGIIQAGVPPIAKGAKAREVFRGIAPAVQAGLVGRVQTP